MDLPEITGIRNKKFNLFGGIDVDFEHHKKDGMFSSKELGDEPDIDPDFLEYDGEGDVPVPVTPEAIAAKAEVNAISAIIAGLPPTNLNVGWEDYYYDDFM
jgi:hypothetical protein